ncbi:hypothetical protein Nepgr_010436 [Nepenthes gracilis]|uniref:Uncharacterized protein n=1 Tax=Nepenthes gracilis TaxID=150966 RepID=A0AAD3XLD9_NEPGR|nr:hypothetical protein Nepgr_010436 [Nepenthes gracilis]
MMEYFPVSDLCAAVNFALFGRLSFLFSDTLAAEGCSEIWGLSFRTITQKLLPLVEARNTGNPLYFPYHRKSGKEDVRGREEN